MGPWQSRERDLAGAMAESHCLPRAPWEGIPTAADAPARSRAVGAEKWSF